VVDVIKCALEAVVRLKICLNISACESGANSSTERAVYVDAKVSAAPIFNMKE
jgi:hypothetical protein